MSTGLPGMESERDFSDAVVEYARLCGWRVHRDPYWRPTATDAGYPDLTLLRERLVFAELKAKRGKTTRDQQAWLEGLREGSYEVYEWRPADWPEIEEVLR